MIDYSDAVSLQYGDHMHHTRKVNSDGTPLRVRVTGKVKTWKTRAGHFRIPVKLGLYESGYVTHKNASDWRMGYGS